MWVEHEAASTAPNIKLNTVFFDRNIEANVEVQGSIIMREVKEIIPRLYFLPKLSFYFYYSSYSLQCGIHLKTMYVIHKNKKYLKLVY